MSVSFLTTDSKGLSTTLKSNMVTVVTGACSNRSHHEVTITTDVLNLELLMC